MIKLFVYKIDDNKEDILLAKMSLLSSDEKEKVERYKYNKDRVRSLLGRLMLICFADRYTDESFPEVNFLYDDEAFIKENAADITLAYDEIGKGRTVNRDNLFFNISHSKDYVVLALSDREVGVDIQEIKPLKADIPKRYFHAKDIEYIDAKEECRLERFTEVWCIKESYSKLTGRGISEGFATFYEDFEQKTVINAQTGEVKAEYKEYDIDAAYKLAVSFFGIKD